MRRLIIIMLMFIALFFAGCVPSPELSAVSEEETYRFGDVTACKTNMEISFYATIAKDQGWTQHLIYLHGYQWLREQSAIVSDALLPDLQQSFAVLNWELWDILWQGIDSERAYDIRVYIEHEGGRAEAGTLVNADDEIHVGDLVFLGCPYFDAVALGTAAQVNCSLCPVFPLEQKALQQRFIRENGQSGFEINEQEMFLAGSRVKVIIRLPV